MKIYLASDHAGFEMKNELVKFVTELGHEAIDCGPTEYVKGDDYPDYISKAGEALSEMLARGEDARAIILGGSGQGEAMVANKYKRVRAAVFYGGLEEIVELSRMHNDANCLSLGARFLSIDGAKEVVSIWLKTPFLPDERHVRRIEKVRRIEDGLSF